MSDDLFRASSRKTLRPHQTKALADLRAVYPAGYKRPTLQLPTGAGKTILAANIAGAGLQKGRRVAFTVPALSLVDQTVEAFLAEGIDDIGVIQSDHPRTNPDARVQICSVQTLARRGVPDVGLVIVGECHLFSRSVREWQIKRPDLPFVGLSATPWRVGMAEEFDTLVVGATIKDLIADGMLSDFRVFAPDEPDLSKVKTVRGEFEQHGLSDVMSGGTLVGNAVESWLTWAENRPTICFAVDRAHAKELQRQFENAGVPTGYIDALTDSIERHFIEREFRAGRIKAVMNCRTLTTGIDWPVCCILDMQPTKSEMLHVQKIGRGLRVNPGIPDCIILDHAGNSTRLGLVTDIHHDSLLDGKGKTSSGSAPERKEPLPGVCPSCKAVKAAGPCPVCGFAPVKQSTVTSVPGQLVEITSKGKVQKPVPTRKERQRWFSELLAIAREKGRSQGWVAHTFKEKFGDWPDGLHRMEARPSVEVQNYVKANDIRFAKGRARG